MVLRHMNIEGYTPYVQDNNNNMMMQTYNVWWFEKNQVQTII